MSYFAILHETPEFITVTHCHVNLWLLKGRLFFDVGIGLRANRAVSRSLNMTLPFKVSGYTDIHAVLKDPTTSELVFGQAVSVTGDGVITILDGKSISSGEKLTTTGLVAAPHERADLSTGEGSVWTIELDREIPIEDCIYFRARFVVEDGGVAWQTHEGGYLLDFRVADTRGTSIAPTWKGLESNIVKIPALNAFVIVPAVLPVRNSHPPFRYVRLLEGKPWANYLSSIGKRSKKLNKKMVAYYWRTEGDKTITKVAPFRAFLDLGPEKGGWRGYLKTIHVSIVVASFVVLFEWTVPHLEAWAFGVQNTAKTALSWKGWAVVGLWMGIITGLPVIVTWIAKVCTWLANTHKKTQ